MEFQEYSLLCAHDGPRLLVLLQLEEPRHLVHSVQIALERVEQEIEVGAAKAVVSLEVVRVVVDPVDVGEGDHGVHLRMRGQRRSDGREDGAEENVADELDGGFGVVVHVVPPPVYHHVHVVQKRG